MADKNRTLKSQRLRTVLYESAGGKCQICGIVLDANWHADHIVPWKISGRTNVHEMQALCSTCNLKKGDKLC